MNKLDEARRIIEEVDLSVAELFEKRMNAARIIAEYKKENNLPIEDKIRETELLKKNSSQVDEKYRDYYKDFLKSVMDISKKYQRNLTNGQLEDSNVIVGRNITDKVGEEFNLRRKVLILTDNGVPREYAEKVKKSSKDGIVVTLPQGEQNKCIETYKYLIKTLIDNNFTRKDCIVAVGGGVVGDLAGFTASTYMRGIDFFNIPTTLLAQVDSSVGGKTAIDFDNCKNTVGAFYQPKKVLIDIDLLKTLPERQFNCGMAEIIKVFATSDKEMFEYLENSHNTDLEIIIKRALLIKKNVVDRDEKEQGLRRVLNFGHTVGHGIESADKTLFHGECVGIGMLCMSKNSARERIKNLLTKYNLPAKWTGNGQKLKEFIIHDKKSEGDKINVISVENIGSYSEKQMTADEIIKKCNEVLTLL